MPDPKPASSGSGGKPGKGGGGKGAGKNAAAPPEGNRFTLWLVTTLALWALWFGLIQPTFFPPPPAVQQAPPDLRARGEGPRGFLADRADDADPGEDEDADGEPAWDAHPERTVTLGGLGPDASKLGYYTQVKLTSRGAAVERIALNDGRYRELTDRQTPLKALGNGDAFVDTFETRVDALDEALRPVGTDSVKADWELAETLPDPDDPDVIAGAVFKLAAPDGSFEAVKTYRLRKGAPDLSPADWQRDGPRDDDPRGYLLDLDLTLRNRAEAPRAARFTVQGPVGLPLENADNTRKFRDIELAYYEAPGELETTYMTAADATAAVRKARASLDADADIKRLDADLLDLQADYEATEAALEADPGNAELAVALEKTAAELVAVERDLRRRVDDAAGVGALDEYRQPLLYVGTEVQYFTALIFPRTGPPADPDQFDPDEGGRLPGFGEDFDKPVIASAAPQVIDEPDRENEHLNDISMLLTSTPVPLAAAGGAGAEATRSFTLFAGPKRPDLLEPLGADGVMDLGWFGMIGWWMLKFLTFAHDWGLPYWLAIISLTVCVRLLMFPLSKRTALMAAKQKALAPKIAEIKERCGEDMQAAGREQWALMNKHGVNPLMGCLPVFFTIPVFIALYNVLLNSADLRLAEFLWIDNLAAPDNVFRLPFRVPYLGWYLNVLPVLLAGLWFFQQKLFMPPAQSPEQEMQYKLMGYMMPLSALFIYHLPAGWCLYSIASACWTLTERKLLDRTRNARIDLVDDPEPRRKGPVGRAVGRLTEKPLARLKEKLEEAQAAAEAARQEATTQQIGGRRERGGAGSNGKAANGRVPVNGKAARRAAGRGKKKSKR